MLFDLDTDMTEATAAIRDKMERLKLVLPEEADKMQLQRFSSRSIPVVAFGVFQEGNEESFIHTVRTFIEPRILRQDGVANVEIITPVEEKEVLIEFDQDTLQSLNLGVAQIVNALAASSLNVSVGELVDAEEKYFVRVMGEYRRLDDISNLIVTPAGLRLKDVARVRYSSRDKAANVTLDGKAGAVLLVTKESEANTVETCENVRRELDRILAQDMFEGVQMRMFFDQSELILSALNNLFKQGIYGGIMALTVLFFFLHRVRPTIIVALAIPTSLLVALVFMFFAGYTLNIVTMVSMIIAVGMLVDNAIVVVENIIRHRQMGEGPKDSARNGASEVGLAIFAATATTWVVFVPMFYIETGRMSVFMEQLGFPLIISLAGSLLIALTLIPLTMSWMRDSKHDNLFQRIEHRIFGDADKQQDDASTEKGNSFLGVLSKLHIVKRIIGAYSLTLRGALNNRLVAVILFVALAIATYAIPYQAVGLRELPKLDTREIKIDVELDQNYDMEMAENLFDQLEGALNQWRDELAIKSILTFYELGGGVIDVYLYTEDDGPIGEDPPYVTEDVMKILSQRLPKLVPGARLEFTITDTSESGSDKAVSLRMRGDDTQLVEEYAERFKSLLQASVPNIRDVTTSVERTKKEFQVRIDEPLATQAGVSPESIAMTVQSALRGTQLPYMKQGGREIPVWAQFREEDRQSKANLDNVGVATASGELVPLNQLVGYQKAPSAASIMRVDGKNVVEISAITDEEDLGGVKAQLQQVIDEFEMQPGYSISFGDSLMELDENVMEFSKTLLMAVILIYLVMSALFESFLFPLSILTTVPLALGGAVWMLYFTNTPMDTVTLIGCILMAGLIVNNGIVIVDHINHIRRSTENRTDAIVLAGQNRFRPVMMTAITTILGLVPLAMATTGGAATFAGLGRAIIGGLTAGTLLTLFIVPLFYSFLDDLQHWTRNFLGGLTRGRSVSGGVRTS
jgi:HAE1 family hydrophobic/amphiphilic exporter-1